MASPPTRCRCVGPDGRRFTLTSPERKPARGKTPDKKGPPSPKKGPSPPKTGKPPPKKRQPSPKKAPSPPKKDRPSPKKGQRPPKKDKPSPKKGQHPPKKDRPSPKQSRKAAREDTPETALSPIRSSARDGKKSKPMAKAEPKKPLRRPPRRKTEGELNALAALGGLRANATKDEITAAYKKLAKEHHPDKGGDDDMFKRIHNAYAVLKPSPKRKFEKK